MTKKAIYYAAALFATLATLAACQQDEGLDALSEPAGDYVTIEFQTDIAEPVTQEFGTRAVDPDGGGVRDMTLFCFDNFGLFVTTVKATLTDQDNLSGKFTASVPRFVRRIHFVANQNMTDFRESLFINKSEAEVLALLEGSAGQMIYWARYACEFIAPQEGAGEPQTTIADELNALKNTGGKIRMLRNHARVSIENPTGNGYVDIVGIEAYNIYAYGTVAPYDPDKGFEFTLDEWKNANYVTLPQRDAKQSDIRSVTATFHQYIFEHDNRMDDPLSIILRGRPAGATEDRYYRVLLIDGNGDFIPVRRNHNYLLNIKGALSYGQPTFEEALTAPATNNVWISISDRVNEVEDNARRLRVSKTFSIHNDTEFTVDKRSIVLNYTVESKDGTPITKENDFPTVTWLDNTVAAQEIRHYPSEFNISADQTAATGTIVVSPRDLGSNNRLEGTLLVKLGRLQRKIKIVVIKEQSFAPSWMSSGIYGKESDEPGEDGTTLKKFAHAALMFTIPETCPSELFPMKVCITAPELDIRSESGMLLPLVRDGDADWYQAADGPANADYKFVYTVEKAGPQRVYFENILNQENGYRGTVYIECQHFATMTRTYTFSELQHAIALSNVSRFTATDLSQGGEDEYVYYYRVAQKTGAYVKLDLELTQKNPDNLSVEHGVEVKAQPEDEFMFYSEHLNNYVAGEYNPEGVTIDCRFAPYTADAAEWQGKRNPNGGRMLMFKPIKSGEEIPPLGPGKYTLHLYTNRARSAEVVRIASNLNNQPAVEGFDPAVENNPLYTGTAYRSFVFELVNYTPFRFGARVRYDNGEWMGAADEPDRTTTTNRSVDKPEVVTPLVWSYEPDKSVEIAIDVTSFKGPDGKSVHPFGREFEIYIDAPMLRLADDATLERYHVGTKLKADPNVPGRFIYTVAADREAERAFGADGETVANVDDAAEAASQAGERKILPFVVNSVASAGDIVISSNEAQTVFYPKTFRVTNESIKGQIQYEVKQNGTSEYVAVAKNTFVAFERVSNNNRIGAVTITADGEFELRLRKEYILDWTGYAVAFHFEHEEVAEDGTTHTHLHHATYSSLADMYEALQRGEIAKLIAEQAQSQKH